MSNTALPAHFDGQQIVLGTPRELAPNTQVLITILSAEDEEDRADWARLGRQNLAAAYGDDEPEYTIDMVKEVNPDYRGPRI